MHGKDRFSATYAVRLRPIHRTQKTCLFGRKPSLFQAGGLSPLHEEALSVLLRGRSRAPPYHAAPPKLPSPSPGAPCMSPVFPLRGRGSPRLNIAVLPRALSRAPGRNADRPLRPPGRRSPQYAEQARGHETVSSEPAHFPAHAEQDSPRPHQSHPRMFPACAEQKRPLHGDLPLP